MIQKQEDYSKETLQDCIDKMRYEKKAVLLHNGMVMGFEGEEKGSAVPTITLQNQQNICIACHRLE